MPSRNPYPSLERRLAVLEAQHPATQEDPALTQWWQRVEHTVGAALCQHLRTLPLDLPLEDVLRDLLRGAPDVWFQPHYRFWQLPPAVVAQLTAWLRSPQGQARNRDPWFPCYGHGYLISEDDQRALGEDLTTALTPACGEDDDGLAEVDPALLPDLRDLAESILHDRVASCLLELHKRWLRTWNDPQARQALVERWATAIAAAVEQDEGELWAVSAP